MKKTLLITVIFCVTVASFLVFTTESFSKAIVEKRFEEAIQGLALTFDPPFLEVPELGITVKGVVIIAPGKEHIVITPSLQFNYKAELENGFVIIDTVEYSNPVILGLVSATSEDHFKIPAIPPYDEEGNIDLSKVEVPNDANLYFKSILAFLDEDGGVLSTFNLNLKLLHGAIQFITFK